MKKIIVFVCGFEEPNRAVNGWNWFYEKENMDNQHRADKAEIPKYKVNNPNSNPITYKGEMEVDVTGLTLHTDEANSHISKQVETFLEENEFEKSFN